MRWRLIVATGMGNGAVTVSSALVGVITLPMLVNYIGVETYGLWVAVNAVAVIGVVGDLGLGNALVSRLATEYHREDLQPAQELVSSGFSLVSAISVVLALTGALAIALLDWRAIFHVPPTLSDSTLLKIIAAAAVGFVGGFPLGFLGRILPALQRGYVVAWYNLAAIWLGALVLWVNVTQKSSVCTVLVWQVAVRLLGSALAVLHTWLAEPNLRPRWRHVTRTRTRELTREGRRQVLMNVGYLISSQSFYLVGPHVLELGALGTMAIAHRIYSMVSTLLVPFYTPLWPAVADAIAQRETKWAVRAFCLLAAVGMILGTIAALIFFFHLSWVYGLLRIKTPIADASIRSVLGLWLVGTIWMQAAGNFLQGTRETKWLAIYMFLSSLGSLPIMVWCGQQYGPAGLIGGWLASYLLICGTGMFLDVRRTLRAFAQNAGQT